MLWRVDSAVQEGVLYHPERKTLIVGDTLMTNSLLSRREGRLELALPLMRQRPPQVDPEALDVERVLVSHGKPVFDDAQGGLEQALAMEHRGRFSAILLNVPT